MLRYPKCILTSVGFNITNNEQFYQDVPQIAEKNGIFLRGKENSIGKEIYDKIKNESEESGTDISKIIQDDKGIWVRSIYLGYGIPNSDDSGENPILSPEPLLIFCDNKG